MRDFLTLLALVVSVSGIGLSLAREEVRCLVGLNSERCRANQQESPNSMTQKSSEELGSIRDRKSPDSETREPSASEASKTLNSSKNPSEKGLSTPLEKQNSQSPPVNQRELSPANDTATTAPVSSSNSVNSDSDTPHSQDKLSSSAEPSDSVTNSSNNGESSEKKADASAKPTDSIPLTVEPYAPSSSQ